MSIEDANAVRDAVIEHLSRRRLNQGAQLLEENALHLPEAVRLECQGTLHFYRGELQEAVRCYEAAIALVPERVIARYQYLVGVHEERAGDIVDAFKRYQAAIEADRGFVDAYVDLGSLLVKVNDLEGAATCYRDALKLEPLEPVNHQNLLAVLGRLAQQDPARYGAELKAAEAAYEQMLPREG